MEWLGKAARSVAHTSCSLSRSTSVTRSTALLWRTSRIESTRRCSNEPADRAAWMPTLSARSRSSADRELACLLLEPGGGGRRHVVRRAQDDGTLVAAGLAQIAGHARLGIGQAGDRHPRLVDVDHAQALERADVDAVAAAAADLFLHDGPRPLGAANLGRRFARGVEDRIVWAGPTAGAAVDADLGIDEIELLFDAGDRGDRAHRLTRGAADAFVVDEIGHWSEVAAV